jgi:asparagine synthetase B (glutamine-hydrolysing)
MKNLREIVKFESYDEACKKYIDDLHYIIKNNRKFQEKIPVLMLSGGVDSMLLGCILKKYFGLKDSITVGCVQDTKDIKVSQDTASKLGIDNTLIFVTLEEVLDNIHLCRGKKITTVFDLVYYLVFKLCLQKTNIKNIDLVQGDGADTLLGSISVFMYRSTPIIMKKYNISNDEARTFLKQRFYADKINPNDKKHKGSGHLFMELAKDLGANAIMAFKHPDILRWVNDLAYSFSRPDKKLLPKKMIEYLGYDPINVDRTIMEKGTGIYDTMKIKVCQMTGESHPNSAVKVLVNQGTMLPI